MINSSTNLRNDHSGGGLLALRISFSPMARQPQEQFLAFPRRSNLQS